MWCRVFAHLETSPDADAIAAHVRGLGHACEARTEADALGWFHLELATNLGHLTLDRFQADEGIRNDLNSWAAWLEIHAGERAESLMQHMIATRQIITLRCQEMPDEPLRPLLKQLLS